MPVLRFQTVRAAAAFLLLLGVVTALAPPAQGSGAPLPADWPAYHGNAARTGYAATMPAASGTPRVTHRLTLDGQVYASPLVVGDQTIVATENNTVYKLGPRYHRAWKIHLGPPSPASERPCGNIDPLGITGTPVYGYKFNVVYVAAELTDPLRHWLYAIDFSSGKVRWIRSLDLPGVETRAMQQRGALTISGRRVFVPFGGLAGDCGNYKGRVVGVYRNGDGPRISYTVPTAREGGIWTPPGPTVDSYHHLYVSVGNGAAGVGDRYDYTDSVLRLYGRNLQLSQYFSPTTWAQDNDADLDLGSMGPALVAGHWILAVGKSGIGYVLDKAHLGGVGGALDHGPVCQAAFGGSAVVSHVVYVPCADGVRAVKVDNTPSLHVLWKAGVTKTGSPVVGGGRVWSLDPYSGILYALDPADGHEINHVNVGGTTRFATPAIYSRRLVIPTLTGITVVSTS